MQEKLLKLIDVDYVMAPYMGENRSGWSPIGDHVLIRPDIVAGQTRGAVHLTEDYDERHNKAAISGIIVALGGSAFKWNADRTRPFDGDKPEVGDHVIF